MPQVKLVQMPVSAIVLAAGASRRLGLPKQLLVHAGETLIERAIRLAHQSGASPVIVVLGAHHELIHKSICLKNATLVINSSWEKGMTTSIEAGINALMSNVPEIDGALILACDQPYLSVGHLQTMLIEFCANQASVIVVSAYKNTLGIPAVFPTGVFADLRGLSGDKGARSLLLKPPCPLIAVPFPGGETDIDLPVDMIHLKE